MPNAVYGIKFFTCTNRKHYKKWERLLHLKGYTVTSNTKVCSNHFKHGQPFKDDPHPSLYLRGYEASKTKRRPLKRLNIENLPKNSKSRKRRSTNKCNVSVQVDFTDILESMEHEHDYYTKCECEKVTCLNCTKQKIAKLEDELERMKSEFLFIECELKKTKERLCEPKDKKFTINKISNSDQLIKFYTGIPTFALFQWLVDQIKSHATNMKYFRGKESMEDKHYQIHNTAKPGPNRSMSIEDEFLLTMMKLRLNLKEDDLAFRFDISQSCVSQIISTWIPFLARELEEFIYWPSQNEITLYYPQCFKKYEKTVRCIIDCTEIQIDRPSLAASNNEVYSQYKSRPTLKCLVGITPGGTISYVSKTFGGSNSDKKIVKKTGIVEKFDEGDICMAGRGFNIQELFLQKQVQLIIPPFKRTTPSTNQFTLEEDTATKQVANARIHVERAIGRLKSFDILQGPIPLNMIDLMDAALIVCSAIVNLQPFLVPLKS